MPDDYYTPHKYPRFNIMSLEKSRRGMAYLNKWILGKGGEKGGERGEVGADLKQHHAAKGGINSSLDKVAASYPGRIGKDIAAFPSTSPHMLLEPSWQQRYNGSWASSSSPPPPPLSRIQACQWDWLASPPPSSSLTSTPRLSVLPLLQPLLRWGGSPMRRSTS